MMMRAKGRRRLRAPVFSRLALAWTGAAGLFALAFGVFAYIEILHGDRAQVSLAIGELETVAPPIANAQISAAPAPLRGRGAGSDGPPALRETPAEAERPGASTIDRLAYPAEFPPEPSPLSEEDNIRITILGGATQAQAASLTPMTAPERPAPIAKPRADLLEASKYGAVPRRGPRGETALDVYAHRAADAIEAPAIAVIVGGLGLNPALTERAIDALPAAISLSFAPYAKDLDFWTDKARADGHEVLIELPMEGHGERHDSLGPAGLLTAHTPAQNLERLEWLMARFTGYVAATNYMGAKFSADRKALAPVLERLHAAGVGYIDDTGAAKRTLGRTPGKIAAADRIIPAASDRSARARVDRELKALEALAVRDGAALGKTYAYAATIDALADWSAALDEKEVALMPASAHLRGRAPSR